MVLSENKRAVGAFSKYGDAEAALRELSNSGFPMSKVSIVARDAEKRDDLAGIGGDRQGDDVAGGATTGAVAGAATGGLIGLIGSLSALTIPGVGPVLAGGALAALLADTLVGGAIGAAAGGLAGALIGLGIPEDRARGYNDRVSRGEYLVLVEGSEDEIRRAEAILSKAGIQDWGIFDAPVRGAGAQRHQRAIGIFSKRQETETALHSLRDANFPMDKVSVIARDADGEADIAGVDVQDRVDNKADLGATKGAVTGGTLGSLTGLLVGLGALAIPGIGPIMLAGAGATALATTLAGGAIGAAAGGLLGGLIGMGIPEDRARLYTERLSQGDYLVLVDGTEAEISRAESLLSSGGIKEWGVYDRPLDEQPSAVTHTTTTQTSTQAPGVPFPETVHDRDIDTVGRRPG